MTRGGKPWLSLGLTRLMSSDVKKESTYRHTNSRSLRKGFHRKPNSDSQQRAATEDHDGYMDRQLVSPKQNRIGTLQRREGHTRISQKDSIPDYMSSPTTPVRHSSSSLASTTEYGSKNEQMSDEEGFKDLGRPLGGIERLYYHSIRQGQDMISLMDQVVSIYPIREDAARKALHLLMLRHPLLKMSIRPEKHSEDGTLKFIRRDDLVCDFYASDRNDWLNLILEEIQLPFNGESKPLWRCRMLNAITISSDSDGSAANATSCGDARYGRETTHIRSNQANTTTGAVSVNVDRFRFTATFVFILHHSIMDGRYSLWIFHDFIRLLDAITLGAETGDLGMDELPLLPPMEACFLHPARQQRPHASKSKAYLEFGKERGTYNVLRDYSTKYRQEIISESKQKPRNCFLTYRCSKDNSRRFLNSCKASGTSVNGAFVTASIFALIDLIYADKGSETSFEIPFEYMLDLRRYYDRTVCDQQVPTYPGVMSYHVPMKACIMPHGRSVSDRRLFWDTAKQFGDSLTCDSHAPDILQWVQSESRKQIENPRHTRTGKSPFVLCLSNMGRLDHVIQGELAERIRLVDIHGHSSILINDMPLFFVSGYTLNEHFCGNISYCAGFTSSRTASEYMGHLLRYIHDYSSL